MSTSIIEQMDQSRYNNIKWFTVSWVVWFGTFILKDISTNKVTVFIIIAIGLIAWGFWSVNLLRLQKLNKIIKADPKLVEALNDELMKHNRNLAFIYGYWSAIVVIGILMIISIYTSISALLVSQITMFVSILSALIASLILNRS